MNFDVLSFAMGMNAAKGSGGSVEDVHFVTFMSEDGITELYKRPVADGDNCADPVERGLVPEPTKESTAQYNYTHVGWSASTNGALDSNILKAVTADKTVYANFAAVLRYYTVTYYDDDGVTVLKTENLAYGATPSYIPTKDDYDFVAWTPNAVVTGEMSYTASWKKKAAFGTATWAEISAITTAGTSASSFKVGDTRDEVLTYADGTTEDIELVIAHIRDDGTMVLASNHALATAKQMHSSFSSSSSSCFNNDLGKYLVNTVYPALPEELRAVIRQRYISYSNKNISLLSYTNLYKDGEKTNADRTYESYDLFITADKRIRKQGKNGTTAVTYWSGTAERNSSGYYYYGSVKTDGSFEESIKGQSAVDGVTTTRGVVFAIDV